MDSVTFNLLYGVSIVGVLIVFAFSLLGADIRLFESYRKTKPREYSNLKWVCRFNGPLVAIMSAFIIGYSSAIALDPNSDDRWHAVFGLSVGVIFLWLSIRWFHWSLRA